jgi:Tfp pilus assembly protein FimT
MTPLCHSTGSRPRPRAGVTLLEILIVMTILLMVTAAAIPLMQPALQNRRGREAARLVSSFISGARSKAIESGRPVGVVFERFNGNGFSTKLSYVEVPTPYSGDTLTSRLLINNAGQIFGIGQVAAAGGTIVSPDTQWTQFLRYGDRIKLDYGGPTWVLASTNSVPDPAIGTPITIQPSLTPMAPALPWILMTSSNQSPPATGFPQPYMIAGVPFQIMRQPTQPRSSTPALQLPENQVVDLFNSGVGPTGQFAVTTNVSGGVATATIGFDPVLVFSPGGSLDYVTDNGGAWGHPLGSLFLLVGRRDQMPDVAPTGRKETPQSIPLFNLTDPDSLWITVGFQTGLVASAENLPPENFTDTDGNGRWDTGEPFVDRNGDNKWTGPESFTDSNNDGVFDAGESVLVDANGDGAWQSGVVNARTFAGQTQGLGGR